MIYSQVDPAYQNEKLPKSNLTIGGYGCFLTSLTNLAGGKVSPPVLAERKKDDGFVDGGLLISSVIAEELEMKATGRTKTPPDGWCIGVTADYAPKYPTHFLMVNVKEGLQIDPLDYPARPEPITYNFYEYRTFDNVQYPLNSSEKESPLPFLLNRLSQLTRATQTVAGNEGEGDVENELNNAYTAISEAQKMLK